MFQAMLFILAMMTAPAVTPRVPQVAPPPDTTWRIDDSDRVQRYRYQHHLRERFFHKQPRARA